MATIDDLPIPRLSAMSEEQLLEMLRDVRAKRLDKPQRAPRAASKSSTTPKLSLDQMINLLSPEMAAKLLEGK